MWIFIFFQRFADRILNCEMLFEILFHCLQSAPTAQTVNAKKASTENGQSQSSQAAAQAGNDDEAASSPEREPIPSADKSPEPVATQGMVVYAIG